MSPKAEFARRRSRKPARLIALLATAGNVRVEAFRTCSISPSGERRAATAFNPTQEYELEVLANPLTTVEPVQESAAVAGQTPVVAHYFANRA